MVPAVPPAPVPSAAPVLAVNAPTLMAPAVLLVMAMLPALPPAPSVAEPASPLVEISPVPEILAQMADGAALSAGDVHDRLARDFDLGPQDEAMVEIAAHLDALVALGLVRRT